MKTFDFIILAVYLLVVLGIGWHCRRHGNTVQGHYLAGRSMGWLPVGLSMMVTTFSAVNFIAISEEVATHGLYVVLSFPVFFLAACPISRIWMPFFQRIQATTVYEFLEQRFSRRIRLMAAALFLLWRFVWMAVALYVSSKILATFTGWDARLLLVLCGMMVAAYTCIGGMRAVMWTDVLQFAVILSCIVMAVILAVKRLPDGVCSALAEGGRLKPYFPFDASFFSLDYAARMSFCSVLLGTFMAFMARYGADQVVMQRYFSAKDLSHARKAIWLNAASSCLALVLLTILGLSLYLIAPEEAHGNSGFALKKILWLSHCFPYGGAGLLLAGLLAATMSSIDSGINACSASLAVDFRTGVSARRLTLLCGGAATVLALVLIAPLHRHQSIFAIVNRFVNGIGTPLLVLVILGMSKLKIAEARLFWGGLLGIILSLTATFCIDHLALHYYAVLNLLLMAVCCCGACLSRNHDSQKK